MPINPGSPYQYYNYPPNNTGLIGSGVNLGDGVPVFSDVNGNNLEFNTLSGTGNVSITSIGNLITISGSSTPSGTFVHITGDTMTGPLVMSGTVAIDTNLINDNGQYLNILGHTSGLTIESQASYLNLVQSNYAQLLCQASEIKLSGNSSIWKVNNASNNISIDNNSLAINQASLSGTVNTTNISTSGSVSIFNQVTNHANDTVISMNYDGNINISGNVIPYNSGTQNLGSSSRPWSNIYGNNIFENGNLVLTSGIGLGNVTITKNGSILNISGAATDLSGYAKLDGTNQPFIGNLNVSGNSSNEYRITDGNYSRLVRTSGNDLLQLNNQVVVLGMDGTGGIITHANGYTIHIFSGNGTFTPVGSITASYLVIGGGGGGGGSAAAGGGAGGLLSGTTTISAAQTIMVGLGGAGGLGVGGPGAAGGFNGNPGSGSSIGTLVIASGGGYGATLNNAGGDGGSGGGGTAGAGGLGVVGQGNNGGTGTLNQTGSGGGGAGAVGGNAGSGGTAGIGGNGGNGLSSNITNGFTGAFTTYAGGGGGGGRGDLGKAGGTGGTGGGGTGLNTGASGTAGTNGLGGGGAGGGFNGTGGQGGQGGTGLVIIAYQVNPVTTEVSLITSNDSSVSGENGVSTFGGSGTVSSNTHINGSIVNLDIQGVNQATITSGALNLTSGTNIVNTSSGASNVGSSTSPLNTIYANDFIAFTPCFSQIAWSGSASITSLTQNVAQTISGTAVSIQNASTFFTQTLANPPRITYIGPVPMFGFLNQSVSVSGALTGGHADTIGIGFIKNGANQLNIYNRTAMAAQAGDLTTISNSTMLPMTSGDYFQSFIKNETSNNGEVITDYQLSIVKIV